MLVRSPLRTNTFFVFQAHGPVTEGGTGGTYAHPAPRGPTSTRTLGRHRPAPPCTAPPGTARHRSAPPARPTPPVTDADAAGDGRRDVNGG
ncbi:hypothetical protein GCM10010215_32070 [Streptomyces virginiae]|uniref:Uncharacterized protein n=1 Tax=Streptomyces virginiae TaxID=1961 RepID=A0ABQ3NIE0_STRVG|nr:hypothetical protein GCM10010215_32070 [Streptomyces virginiae]GHI12543.1 hypothetical protein Scinn_20060 [Streptomyces virginiae]